MYKIGIDVGGTFTDFVVAKESESPSFFKTSSIPGDPSEGVMTGLRQVADAFALRAPARPLRHLFQRGFGLSPSITGRGPLEMEREEV